MPYPPRNYYDNQTGPPNSQTALQEEGPPLLRTTALKGPLEVDFRIGAV